MATRMESPKANQSKMACGNEAGDEDEIEEAAGAVHRPIVGEDPQDHRRAPHAAQPEQKAAEAEGEPFPHGMQLAAAAARSWRIARRRSQHDQAHDLAGEVLVLFANEVQHIDADGEARRAELAMAARSPESRCRAAVARRR